MERHSGIVKWFDVRKGYGFLTDDLDGRDYFVHHTGIKSNVDFKVLHEHQKVMFEVGQGKKGVCAVNVEAQLDNNPLPEWAANIGTSGGANGKTN